ncbi:MAG: ABC transporter ATP-binding protein [Actinomycetota bacterium]|nr:ABC transporter ATP-binding protein [Actinomycetota bacterium]
MIGALETTAVTKRYGAASALAECNLRIPAGHVAALVGPNGAGKTTLLHLAMGFLKPTSGRVTVFGWSPQEQPAVVLPRVGFLAQDRPLYKWFKVQELLEFGRQLNPRWDPELAKGRLNRLGIPMNRPVGKLSGGQQAQVALALTLAKRPEMLLLDEPLSNLDPVARREFLQVLMDAVAEDGLTVILSSHIIAELERTCDYLVVLAEGRVQLSGEIERLLDNHRTLVGGPCERALLERDPSVIQSSHTPRQTTMVVKMNGTPAAGQWEEHPVGLEELVLAYLSRRPAENRPQVEATASTGRK